MELLTTDAFEPRWKIWTNFGVDRAAALATDSLRASRAIEYPVGRPEEAEDMFDVITYDKGGSVLRMIERHLGDDNFRRGLNLYLDKHRYSNTDTTDLWDALEVASGQPVRATMGTWVNQPGHPLVSVELAADGTRPKAVAAALPSRRRHGRRPALGCPRQPALRHRRRSAPTRAVPARGRLDHRRPSRKKPAWVLVNEGAWGVYRVRYSDELRGRTVRRLGPARRQGTPEPGRPTPGRRPSPAWCPSKPRSNCGRCCR